MLKTSELGGEFLIAIPGHGIYRSRQPIVAVTIEWKEPPIEDMFAIDLPDLQSRGVWLKAPSAPMWLKTYLCKGLWQRCDWVAMGSIEEGAIVSASRSHTIPIGTVIRKIDGREDR
jgi:hypothetical protein